METDAAARIAQAQGMVSVFDGCTLDEALARMSQCARENARPLQAVADIVIGRHTRLVLAARSGAR